MYRLLFLCVSSHSARSPTHYQLDTSTQPLYSPLYYTTNSIQIQISLRVSSFSFFAGLSSSQDMTKPSSLGGITRSREVCEM